MAENVHVKKSSQIGMPLIVLIVWLHFKICKFFKNIFSKAIFASAHIRHKHPQATKIKISRVNVFLLCSPSIIKFILNIMRGVPVCQSSASSSIQISSHQLLSTNGHQKTHRKQLSPPIKHQLTTLLQLYSSTDQYNQPKLIKRLFIILIYIINFNQN